MAVVMGTGTGWGWDGGGDEDGGGSLPTAPSPHVVICVSRKMRMKTSRAGTTEANIIQMGKGAVMPMGWMNQPRAALLVTSSPLGTFSFCAGEEMADQALHPAAPPPPTVCTLPACDPPTCV